MYIVLIDVDSHNFPNLALMKISAWHKLQGDNVEWCSPFFHYDIVYQSKVFSDTYSPDIDYAPNADKIIKGGTGYSMTDNLPYETEHIYPDYSIYPELTKNTAYGFLTRGCPRGCKFCIVGKKEGLRSVKVADLSEFWKGQKHIILLDPNILACKEHLNLLQQLADSKADVNFSQGLDIRLTTSENIEALNKIKVKMIHFAWDNPKNNLIDKFKIFDELSVVKDERKRKVYVLTNFDSTIEQDLYRVYTLRELHYDPYIMVYEKPTAPKIIKQLQRWVNNKIIFRACNSFDEYLKGASN